MSHGTDRHFSRLNNNTVPGDDVDQLSTLRNTQGEHREKRDRAYDEKTVAGIFLPPYVPKDEIRKSGFRNSAQGFSAREVEAQEERQDFRKNYSVEEVEDNKNLSRSHKTVSNYDNFNSQSHYIFKGHSTHWHGSHRPSPPKSSSLPPYSTSPSSSYLNLSIKPSSVSSASQKKLLILDLNGTLVFRTSKSLGSSYRKMFPRPFMRSFQEYLFCEETRAWLDVMVWSSAQPHNVTDMVDKCFSDNQKYLIAVWGRDTLGLRSDEYSRKIQTTKDLDKPWSTLASEEDIHHSAESTVLLDDSPAKARLQPYNHICIPEYDIYLRRKDLISASADIARRLLREKVKGMAKYSKSHRADQAEAAESKSVPVTNIEHISSSTTTEIDPTSHSSDTKRNHPVSSSESTEDMKPSKKKKKKQSRFGPANMDDISETNNRDEKVASSLSFDQTLIAVIGIFEEARQQSNIAGWIRSGGLWAGHYDVSNKLSTTDGLVTEYIRSEEKNRKKYSSIVDAPTSEDNESFPPSSQTLVDKTGEDNDNDNDHSVKDEGLLIVKKLTPEVVVAAGNDESIVDDTPPGRQLQGSNNTGDGNDAVMRYVEDTKLPLWFENPEVVLHWASRGREALKALGIPEVHGVQIH